MSLELTEIMRLMWYVEIFNTCDKLMRHSRYVPLRLYIFFRISEEARLQSRVWY